MKKQTLGLIASLFFFVIMPMQSSAVTENDEVKEEKKIESAEAKLMINRLNEIMTMDKSDLSSEERKELRKEVKSIKRDMKELGGGVYISAGVLIIIVLLIVLLA